MFVGVLASSCFIRERTDYVRLLSRGKAISDNGWMLYYAPNGLNFPRFSVVLSKRHIRLSVARNRLRRQLRESFRQEWRWQLPAVDFLLRAVAPPPPAAMARKICLHLLLKAAKRK